MTRNRAGEIRKAGPDDIPALAALQEGYPEAWTEEQLRAELGKEIGIFLCALSDGKPAGYLSGYVIPPDGHLANLCVDPARRRQGIGSLLLGEFLLRARERGCGRVTLEVRAGAAAVELYRKFGWKVTGERRNLYSSPDSDGYVMELTLSSGDP
jgi:ribosomal-protein-alanine N-acetyltransferase